MYHRSLIALTTSLLMIAASRSPAQMRTWVSGTGSDANACTRVAPCRTFAGALAKTAAGGEIRVLDAGEFGTATLTITKPITIDGGDALATMTATSNAIVVNAGNDDIVILRNLAITTTATGLQPAIAFQNGKQLIVEGARITGVNCEGVAIIAGIGSGARTLVVSNSTITGTRGGGVGVRAYAGNAYVSHTIITAMGIGLLTNNTGVINADSNVLTGNQTAVQAGTGGSGQGAAIIRVSNNDIYNNRIGFGCGGGVIASAGNNRKGSNVNTGPEPVCSPNATLTQQ